MRLIHYATFAGVLLVQVSFASCAGNDTLGVDDMIGEYVLVTVNGEELPAPGLVNAVYQAGSLVLSDDGTFTVTLDTVVLGMDVIRIVEGTFSVVESSIQFAVTSVTSNGQPTSEEGSLSGTWEGNTITIVEDLEFVFERQ